MKGVESFKGWSLTGWCTEAFCMTLPSVTPRDVWVPSFTARGCVQASWSHAAHADAMQASSGNVLKRDIPILQRAWRKLNEIFKAHYLEFNKWILLGWFPSRYLPSSRKEWRSEAEEESERSGQDQWQALPWPCSVWILSEAKLPEKMQYFSTLLYPSFIILFQVS